jgi:predicted nucleic acid-binding protein
MLAVDTNVIVRIVTHDDPNQVRRAVALFEREHIFIAYFPHPAKEAKPYPVEQARDFLTAIGVNP